MLHARGTACRAGEGDVLLQTRAVHPPEAARRGSRVRRAGREGAELG